MKCASLAHTTSQLSRRSHGAFRPAVPARTLAGALERRKFVNRVGWAPGRLADSDPLIGDPQHSGDIAIWRPCRGH